MLRSQLQSCGFFINVRRSLARAHTHTRRHVRTHARTHAQALAVDTRGTVDLEMTARAVDTKPLARDRVRTDYWRETFLACVCECACISDGNQEIKILGPMFWVCVGGGGGTKEQNDLSRVKNEKMFCKRASRVCVCVRAMHPGLVFTRCASECIRGLFRFFFLSAICGIGRVSWTGSARGKTEDSPSFS